MTAPARPAAPSGFGPLLALLDDAVADQTPVLGLTPLLHDLCVGVFHHAVPGADRDSHALDAFVAGLRAVVRSLDVDPARALAASLAAYGLPSPCDRVLLGDIANGIAHDPPVDTDTAVTELQTAVATDTGRRRRLVAVPTHPAPRDLLPLAVSGDLHLSGPWLVAATMPATLAEHPSAAATSVAYPCVLPPEVLALAGTLAYERQPDGALADALADAVALTGRR